MFTVSIVLLLIGFICFFISILLKNSDLTFLAFTVITIGLFTIPEIDYQKKDSYITIYTPNNIYYLYNDSLTSENGEDEVRDGKWKEAYIEMITAKSTNSSINKAEFPEEWNEAKKGDTLIITDVINGIPQIGFFNYKNR